MWDARYAAAEGYLFGTEPSGFVRARAGVLSPGARILCLADGEGRNSVWLAGQGHRVTASEQSGVALEKARALAAARGVSVRFVQEDIETAPWPEAAHDAVLGVFIQFAPPGLRAAIHAGIRRTLVPGGLVLLHGYAPRQIANGTGGPRAVENLYTLDGLAADFPGWEVLVAEDYDADLAEGTGHHGKSALIDFIARKP
jgi:SAM-dependent methyltransferase